LHNCDVEANERTTPMAATPVVAAAQVNMQFPYYQFSFGAILSQFNF
jgi:hypothetical protein